MGFLIQRPEIVQNCLEAMQKSIHTRLVENCVATKQGIKSTREVPLLNVAGGLTSMLKLAVKYWLDDGKLLVFVATRRCYSWIWSRSWKWRIIATKRWTFPTLRFLPSNLCAETMTISALVLSKGINFIAISFVLLQKTSTKLAHPEETGNGHVQLFAYRKTNKVSITWTKSLKLLMVTWLPRGDMGIEFIRNGSSLPKDDQWR